jgi:hypothetical protein
VHGLDAQHQAATTAGHIPRAHDTEVSVQAHVPQEGQERVLEVEGRRRKVLEQAPGEVKAQGTLREGRDWQQGQSQHSGGAGAADVPLEVPSLGQPARAKEQCLRANFPPF